jgi:dihydroorotate dehydrogenase
MPDWAYRTVFRPILFSQPADAARDFTLGAMGTLDALPGGPAVIDFMGHMHPPLEIKRSLPGLDLPGPVGLGAGLDLSAVGASALSRFGFGFIEPGPVTSEPVAPHNPVERLPDQQTLRYTGFASIGVEQLIGRLERLRPLTIPIGFRLAARPGSSPQEAAAEWRTLCQRLSPYAAFFSLDAPTGWYAKDWQTALAALLKEPPTCPVLICVRPSTDMAQTESIIGAALKAGVQGVVVAEDLPADGARLVGPLAFEGAHELVRAIRAKWESAPAVIAGGGIHQPHQALAMLDAGADLIQIHSGLVYSGPGLPKRINEALAYRSMPSPSIPLPTSPGALWRERSWLAFAIIAAILIISGAAASVVAATSVVLPYDEAFVGTSRAGLRAINDHLLDFMAHDRITLSGTMLSTGLLYLGLSLWGVRYGMRWARTALIWSCIIGILTFFTFVGFGYFDPLHAFLTGSIVPFLLLAISGSLPASHPIAPPNLREDRGWLAGQWGQMIFILIGFGLIVAGTTITTVGTVSVFVPEDLRYLGTTTDLLRAANPRLLALIAHDRVGFGGNLIANGIAVLLLAMWGYRQGYRWIWWTLLGAGLVGFAGALGVHLAVGYLDFVHLFPAALALGLFGLGLALSYPYLFKAPDQAA